MDKNTLYEALAGFNGVTNIKLDSEKRVILSKQFSELATKIFRPMGQNGCFSKRKMPIRCFIGQNGC